MISTNTAMIKITLLRLSNSLYIDLKKNIKLLMLASYFFCLLSSPLLAQSSNQKSSNENSLIIAITGSVIATVLGVIFLKGINKDSEENRKEIRALQDRHREEFEDLKAMFKEFVLDVKGKLAPLEQTIQRFDNTLVKIENTQASDRALFKQELTSLGDRAFGEIKILERESREQSAAILQVTRELSEMKLALAKSNKL